MPIFEYKCGKCGYVFEQLCMRKDEDCAVCPSCGSREAARIMSMFSSGKSGMFGGIGSSLSSSCSPRGGFS